MTLSPYRSSDPLQGKELGPGKSKVCTIGQPRGKNRYWSPETKLNRLQTQSSTVAQLLVGSCFGKLQPLLLIPSIDDMNPTYVI